MSLVTIQGNLTRGCLSPLLESRIDLDVRQHGLSEATNVIVSPFGGMRRRAGLSKITDSEVADDGRLVKFVFNTQQTYLLFFEVGGKLSIFKNGVIVNNSILTDYITIEMINEMDIIHSGDTLVITHPLVAPTAIQRQGTDTNWAYTEIPLVNVPRYNFDNPVVWDYRNTGILQEVDIKAGDVIYNRDGNDINGLDYTYYRYLGLEETEVDISIEDFAIDTRWELILTEEKVWSSIRGYPSVCTFYQSRLWFAGTDSLPNSIWGSRTNGFYDFEVGADSDHALFDTLDTGEINRITNIFTGRTLQVFTTSNEFYNESKIITPSDSSWEIQTGYGAKRLRPIQIDGATLFVDSSKRSIRRFVYEEAEDAYTSNSITLLSSHLVTDVLAMDMITGTDVDISDFVYVVNTDGTVAVLNTLKSENILGWTKWDTQGTFLDVVVVDKEVYFLVKRLGAYFIEKLQEGTHTDHNVNHLTELQALENIVQDGDNIVQGADNIIYTANAITTLQTNYSDVFVDTEFDVVADYMVQPNQKYSGVGGDNTITIDRSANIFEVGLNYNVSITTMDLSNTLKNGATLHRRKKVVKVMLSVVDSLGVKANDVEKSDRQFIVVLDNAPALFTGMREMYLLGYSRETRIRIFQDNPLPFILRSIGWQITY